MKELLAGIVLILVVGIGGFMYRNVLERSAAEPETPSVCTLEARLCPDGSAVGRTGPSCTFAACPFPNIEIADLGVALLLPQGYVENPAALGEDQTLVRAYEKPAGEGSPAHAIVVRRFAIPAGSTAEQTILANTMLEPSGLTPTAQDFETVTLGATTYRRITLERFEAQVHSVYYLPRATDVLRFEVLERDVFSWTDPALTIDTLPEHAAFRRMLETLSATTP